MKRTPLRRHAAAAIGPTIGGELDLVPYLEPAWRLQRAHAVGHVGLIGALRRISGGRQATNVVGEA